MAECILHYPGLPKYSTIKPITNTKKSQIFEAKCKREDLGGEYHHKEQCEKIPPSIEFENHVIHPECFAKFINVNSECIVHYPGLSAYSKIKAVTETNMSRIVEAKCTFETASGENHHEEQCRKLPKNINIETQKVHPECYKKFTLILSNKSLTSSDQASSTTTKEYRLSERLASSCSLQSRASWVYTEECHICGKVAIYDKKARNTTRSLITICTDVAVATVTEASQNKNPSLYDEIKDLDLIAKEFKYHRCCYIKLNKKVNTASTTTTERECVSSTFNFELVKRYIKHHVLEMNEVVSMKVLVNIYGSNDDHRYRGKLKDLMLREFPDNLLFLQPSPNVPEIVVNKNSVLNDTVNSCIDKEKYITKAAEYLREDILHFAEAMPNMDWPPTFENLNSDDRKPPCSVTTFLQKLLKSDKHSAISNSKVSRLVDSYAADLVHGVTRGTVIPSKHFVLAMGLHNLTGSRKVIEITNKLGHCIDYNTTCEIETAIAEKMQCIANESTILPLRPENDDSFVPTYFWVDNFDVTVEMQAGGGSVNTTHLVAFQEPVVGSTSVSEKFLLQRTKRRMLQVENSQRDTNVSINKKAVPTLITEPEKNFNFDTQNINLKYLVWLLMRKVNGMEESKEKNDQVIPNFSGWLMKGRPATNLKKTITKYLPPINAKVTEFTTIIQYMEYLQSLTKSSNMPYVNITLDIGAAVNAYKVIWNLKDKFANIVIHPGDFHFMKENFQVIGLLVSSIGFEDLVFQANVCSSGSLNGVLAGNHYNRAWLVHSVVSEAMERLLLCRFFHETIPNISAELREVLEDSDSFPSMNENVCSDLLNNYECFKQNIRDGNYGKTAQFWLMYLDMMKHQHYIHTAVQENNFDLRLYTWDYFVPFYFATNKSNYARYGSYYVHQMKSIDIAFPGLKGILTNNCISVQAQERYAIRTAIDQRGEQTLNRDAKITGGIKAYAADSASVLKWTLNRAEQATNMRALYQMCNINTSSTMYKPIRPSEILKSEERVSNVVTVLRDEYINPFDAALDKEHLYDLSSGSPLPEKIAEKLLALPEEGRRLAEVFCNERLLSNNVSFHEKIKRNIDKASISTKKVSVIRRGDTVKSVEVNRNILGKLVSYAVKSQTVIDYAEALTYPLSPIPLSLSHANGVKRSCTKWELIKIFLPAQMGSNKNISSEDSVFIYELMAGIRTITNIPATFEDLVWKIIKWIPTGHRRIDFIADSYRDVSIKSSTRDTRGTSSKLTIKSSKSKLPRNFKEFLSAGENKSGMIDLMFEVIERDRVKVLNLLRTEKLFLSKEESCRMLTLSSAANVMELKTNQEEADTRLILHAHHALIADQNLFVIIRAVSKDTDVIVLAIALLDDFKERVLLDVGPEKSRECFALSNFDIGEGYRKSIIGFHAYTGNDYVSSFFKKGKRTCWNKAVKEPRFLSVFSRLGDTPQLRMEDFQVLEEFTCRLYNGKGKSINTVRFQLFKSKNDREEKFTDLSLLPPCQSVLKLHSMRANAVAFLWKNALSSRVEEPKFSECGWDAYGQIQWVTNIFPPNVEAILFDENDMDDGENAMQYGQDIESADEAEDD